MSQLSAPRTTSDTYRGNYGISLNKNRFVAITYPFSPTNGQFWVCLAPNVPSCWFHGNLRRSGPCGPEDAGRAIFLWSAQRSCSFASRDVFRQRSVRARQVSTAAGSERGEGVPNAALQAMPCSLRNRSVQTRLVSSASLATPGVTPLAASRSRPSRCRQSHRALTGSDARTS